MWKITPPVRKSIHPTILPILQSTVTLKTTHRTLSTPKEEPFYGLPRQKKTSLSTIDKLSLAITSGASVLLNPKRADALAALSEVTGTVALQSMYDKMKNDAVGREILNDKPLVNNDSIDLEALRDGCSFGYAYASFMNRHGFDPDERSQVKYISDPELAYVMLRYRQCHDFFHVLFNLPPTVLGELALKYIELLQTGLPSTALSVTLGQLQLTSKERHILHRVYLPWAVRIVKESNCFLMNVYYEKELDTDLEELRDRLGVFPAPDPNEIFNE